jgi:hypothetical protein
VQVRSVMAKTAKGIKNHGDLKKLCKDVDSISRAVTGEYLIR